MSTHLSYQLEASTFQHCHGVMLVNLNKIAFELKLSHAEYHLMGVLIGFWNKKQGRAYPGVKTLAEICRMSNSTVKKCIDNLTRLGLIYVCIESGRKQNFYLNLAKLLDENFKLSDPQNLVTACSKFHEQTDRNKIIEKTDFLKNKTIKNNNKTITQNSGTNFMISEGRNISSQNFTGLKTQINEGLKYVKDIEAINEPRLSKIDIIQKLEKENRLEEALTLKTLWRIQ